MTTIAYKDGFLAADRMCNRRGTPTITLLPKIAHHNGIAWGVSGDIGMIDYVTDFVIGSAEDDGVMTVARNLHAMLSKDKREDYVVMLLGKGVGGVVEVAPDGVAVFDAGKSGFAPGCGFAIGSGADYAMGAMAHGASAMHAIDIASKLDATTGLGSTVIALNSIWKDV